MSQYSECEAGEQVPINGKCHRCGRRADQFCANPPPDPRIEEIKRLRGQVQEAYSQIIDLRAKLRSYKEREKVQGWADL